MIKKKNITDFSKIDLERIDLKKKDFSKSDLSRLDISKIGKPSYGSKRKIKKKIKKIAVIDDLLD